MLSNLPFEPLVDRGTGVPVVVIYPLSGNGARYDFINTALCEVYRFIVPRLPHVSAPVTEMRYYDLCQYVRRFVTFHGLKCAYFIGIASGAQLVMKIVAMYPTLVKGVLLAEDPVGSRAEDLRSIDRSPLFSIDSPVSIQPHVRVSRVWGCNHIFKHPFAVRGQGPSAVPYTAIDQDLEARRLSFLTDSIKQFLK